LSDTGMMDTRRLQAVANIEVPWAYFNLAKFQGRRSYPRARGSLLRPGSASFASPNTLSPSRRGRRDISADFPAQPMLFSDRQGKAISYLFIRLA
jgi:hypothetical protein